MKKLILLMTMLLCFVSFIYADNMQNFYNSGVGFFYNNTYNANPSSVFPNPAIAYFHGFITHSVITNYTFTLTGMPQLTNSNLSVITNNTGKYWETGVGWDGAYTGEKMRDGDWGTSGRSSGAESDVYVNYTKPTIGGVVVANNNSKFVFGYTGVNTSIYLPKTCWDGFPNKVIISKASQKTIPKINVYCLNGSMDVINLGTWGSDGYFFEGAMNWSINYTGVNFSCYQETANVSNNCTNAINTYPSQYRLQIGGQGNLTYNETSQIFNYTKTVSANITLINDIIDDCASGTEIDDLCYVQFFHSANSSGYINFTLTQLNYSFGIDNCSTFTNKILNITWKDQSNSLTNVNLTIYIDLYGGNSTQITQYQKNFTSLCAPSLYPVDANVTINYYDNDGNAYKYTLTDFTDGVTNVLTLYTIGSPSETIITAIDKNSLDIVNSVLATQYKFISGQWVGVAGGYTDVSGKIKFNYEPNVKYKFFFGKTGYEDYIFYLDPILYSTYTITMTPTTDTGDTPDFFDVAVEYAGTNFSENTNSYFVFLIQSPSGYLKNYSYTITTPSSYYGNQSNTPTGSQLTTTVAIGDVNVLDSVLLTYCWNSSLSGMRCFSDTFSIAINDTTTLVKLRDQHYGMGLLERVLIAVAICILFMGIATLIGQPITGFVVALGILGYLSYIGLIEIWVVIIPIVLGVILISLTAQR